VEPTARLDPTIEEMLNKNPLIVFSGYTNYQSRTVRELGQDILKSLDPGTTPDDATGLGILLGAAAQRVYGQFWLWVLGAYEVVRTMCQAERCFSERLATELKALKQRLADIRMPFAKQELRGHSKPTPVCSEPSISGISVSPPDFRFLIKDEVISARDLICEFARVFEGITRADVLKDHRTTYQPGAN
jgi:hypothetical protein